MRKEVYRGTDDDGRALLSRAPIVHIATLDNEGAPLLRALNAVVVDDVIAFHGAPAGEKTEGVGRPVVVTCEEIVASIPSYFLDPERACPATTFYRSAQVHGTLDDVRDPEKKARVLAAFMAKYQPEGGHVPIDADHPLYRKAIAGIMVLEVSLDKLTCKDKLGQNRSPAERVRVLEQLWKRGLPGDARAIATIVGRFPELPRPSFLPADFPALAFQCDLDETEFDEAATLVSDAYWLRDVPREMLLTNLRASSARVGARDSSGRLVAFARAVADGRTAWIYDVMIAPSTRANGVGSALMRLLLDHPAVRKVRHVRLGTRDAVPFYRRLGFGTLEERPRHPWSSTEMIRCT